jgi:hypothetical protein
MKAEATAADKARAQELNGFFTRRGDPRIRDIAI